MTQSDQRIGIFTTDAELTVRSWDAWLARATSISAEDAYHRPLIELVPNLESRGVLARFRRVLSDGVVEVLAPAFHRHLIPCPPLAPAKHFTSMQQWVTIAPLRENDRIVGTIVTVEDVTARLDYERDLAEQLASPDEATRLRAACAIEETKGPAHMLVGAIEDQSWRVRRTAVSGLTRHGGAEAVAALLQALRHEHRNPSVLNSALQVLALTDVDIVPPLVECLRAPDSDLRIYAALSLGDRLDERAILALLDALADDDANVRYHTIEALGKLRAEAAVDPLLAIAESRDFFLAFPAIDALTRIGDRRAGPRLALLLEDELLRVPVAEALGQLGDETAVASLIEVLNAPEAPALAVVQALAALHDRYQQTYGEGRYVADLARGSIGATGARNLLDALDQAHEADLRALALVLGWLEGPAVERTLARLLGQPAVRKAVLEALVRHGSGVTELLIEQLGAEDLETRQAAVVALGRIGDARAVPALLGVLNDDPELATVAASALGAIGDQRAFEGLLGLVGHPAAPVRQAAVGALNSLGHPELAARALPLLADPDPRVRESAVKIAGYFGYPNCVDALLERCDDQDERVRRAAVEHLPYLDDPRVLPALAQALHTPVSGVRAAAARALAQVDSAPALPHLLAALDDADPWVRYFAARSLGHQRSSEALDAITRLVQADPANHVRIAAMETLGQIGGVRAVALLAPFAAAADPDIARAALGALGKIGHPDALGPLEELLHAPDPARRIEALRALSRRAGDEVVPILRRVAAGDREPDVAQAALEALAQVGTEEAVAALVALSADAARRAECIAALGHLGEPQVDWLARGLEDADAGVRGAVVEALARMKRPRASEHLRAALDDRDASVRLAAATALGQLGSRYAERQLAILARSDPDLAVRRAAHAALQMTR
jgi:HEAT repeat protein